MGARGVGRSFLSSHLARVEINQGCAAHQTLLALTPWFYFHKDLESHLNLSPWTESLRSNEMLPCDLEISPMARGFLPASTPPLRSIPGNGQLSKWCSLATSKRHRQFSREGHSMYTVAPHQQLLAVGSDLPQPLGTMLNSLPSPHNI